MKIIKYFSLITLMSIGLGFSRVSAQQNLAKEVRAIFEQSCLSCHGPSGAFKNDLLIESAEDLITSGAVVQGKPDASKLYTRLLEVDPTKRMPLGGRLPFPQIQKIEQWIQAGAPGWESQHDVNFITTNTMFTAIQRHLETLSFSHRPYARYFSMTHLYNAGESPERLKDYRAALSKLVNSLSWMEKIINPEPIDAQETIFYIDLRYYDWDSLDVWTQLENIYPYDIEYDAETQAGLHGKLTNLREEMACEVPFIHVDWFLATASLPPLYHDILDLPTTDRELEKQLGIDVKENRQRTIEGNLQDAPEQQVLRAGFNNSGVSSHNRVVERHTSPYGAYWKSYDFAGSAEIQNVSIHPLTFRHDGGEVVFNLPNGLQAYYITDASGNRIDAAPIEIVRNPETSDPTVRTGQSCIGCHAKGIQLFEDEVRAVTEKKEDPPFDKGEVFRLYVPQNEMDGYLRQDTQRFKAALEATGNAFDVDGTEPVQFLSERFKDPLNAAHAAAAVGLETEVLRDKIEKNSSLQNGLANLLIDGGTVKRDAWTSNFEAVVTCLYGDDCVTPFTLIPDVNLHAAIAEELGKAPDGVITKADLARLTQLEANEADINSLTGLEHAKNLERIVFRHNAISDLSPLAELTRLKAIYLDGNRITDVSPLEHLTNVDVLGLAGNVITDLSSLKGFVWLNSIGISDNPVDDVSPLAGIFRLRNLNATRTDISDFSPLAKLPILEEIVFGGYKSVTTLPSLKGLKTLRSLKIIGTSISDISGLSELTQLTTLALNDNAIKDVSPLAALADLKELNLSKNDVSDVSPLAGLTNLERLDLRHNRISDFSPLEGLSENTIVQSGGNLGTFQQAAPKITGPWLWMIAPTEGRKGADAAASGRDFLAQMSKGSVTEKKIATDGAIVGDPVGDKVWTSAEISATASNNLNNMANDTGLGSGDIDHHVAYGSIALDSPREQETQMFVGSDDAVKVWLNGALVHNHPTNRGADDYQDQFAVTLKAGTNILLVAVYEGMGGWTGFFGFKAGTEYTVSVPGFLISTDTQRIAVGTTFTVHLKAEKLADLAGWQTDITFDPTVLKADKVSEGDFLKQAGGSTHFKVTIPDKQGKITDCFGVRTSEGGARGQGTLLSIQFTVLAEGWTYVTLRDFKAVSSTTKPIDSPPIEILIVVEGQPNAPTLVPEDTTVFHNYPNPFNPETWIPYQLEQPADVKIAIYAANGQLVRLLNLGHQAAGYYIGKHRAAHWDGKNTVGEPVASGVYFYQLQADNLSFLRKMVILK